MNEQIRYKKTRVSVTTETTIPTNVTFTTGFKYLFLTSSKTAHYLVKGWNLLSELIGKLYSVRSILISFDLENLFKIYLISLLFKYVNCR